jgi:hypothetical protein
MDKPPIGVMPRSLWINQRREDLARAIYEYLIYSPESQCIEVWIEEMKSLNKMLKEINNV